MAASWHRDGKPETALVAPVRVPPSVYRTGCPGEQLISDKMSGIVCLESHRAAYIGQDVRESSQSRTSCPGLAVSNHIKQRISDRLSETGPNFGQAVRNRASFRTGCPKPGLISDRLSEICCLESHRAAYIGQDVREMHWGPGCRHCFQVDLGPSRAPTDPPTTPTRDRLDVISKLGFWCRGSRARTKHGLSFPKLFHAED